MNRAVDIPEAVDLQRLDINTKLVAKTKSELGQFLTPAPIAKFMASLFNKIDKKTCVLDAGAGIGSLSAAFIDEIISRRKTYPSFLEVVAYESDPMLADYLEDTITSSLDLCAEMGINISKEILNQDFIKHASSFFNNDLFSVPEIPKSITHVIMNPPYKKINSNSVHRELLRKAGIETTNLYTGFLALAIKLLIPSGELVAIIPRSFCNGPYFKPFRELLLSEMSIRRIHIFNSRDKAFKEDEVLQENIIFHAIKNNEMKKVLITSSDSSNFFDENGVISTEDMTNYYADINDIVKPDNTEKVIHIPTSKHEQAIVDSISLFDAALDNLEISVSTGPVIDFRLKEELSRNFGQDTAPLLYPVHFNSNTIDWPKESKKPNAIHINKKTQNWLWENSGYFVLTKRFSAKEEKRRIVAVVYEGNLPGKLIGFENHLNVFHNNKKGFSKEIALGLATYLNCTLVDKYFRQFNGHTQVNSSDLRMLHYPNLETLCHIGKETDKNKLNQDEIDDIINMEINKMAKTTKLNPVKAQKKIDDALNILKILGLPKGQHNERSALTLLAILNLKPNSTWNKIEQPLIGITPIMDFSRDEYGKEYAPNSRETFRRQTMHQFVDAGIATYNPDEPGRAINSPKACYQITPEAFTTIKTFRTKHWKSSLTIFLKQKKTLAQRYAMERNMEMIPVEIAKDKKIKLTPGSHSELIRDIITEFAPRYAPASEVIYVGDTGDKIGYFQKHELNKLGVTIDKHGKMPDVVLFYRKKNWLLLIESVTSHGPVDSKRHHELAELFMNSKIGLVYVTAFPNKSVMGKYLSDISWETEVWIADNPTHLIHFNGKRFLGPYKK